MKEFVIKRIKTPDIESELNKIGFDSCYINKAAGKFRHENIKIYDLTPAQANILKQTSLSVGADCATNRGVIKGEPEISDVILTGSLSQIKKIAEKLRNQPFSLKELSEKLINHFNKREVHTKLAGIVNVTPDSFSDGGLYFDKTAAIDHVYELIEDGADIVDIGAESTRPFSKGVDSEEQIKRLAPVLKELSGVKIPISIDTRSSLVAEYVLDNGASIINDVSGLSYDPRVADIAAKYNATVIIQHSQGTPESMQNNPEYSDVIEEIYFYLKNKTEFAKYKGVKNIIIDAGIGFGKTKENNFEILDRIEEFYDLGFPLMAGVSRKSMLGLNDSDDNNLKDALTLAVSYPLMKKKIDYLRVHNVKLHKQLLNSANL